MPLTVLPQGSVPPETPNERAPIVIGLVNNMPDSALEATETQFSRLLRAAAGPLQVHLRWCYLPEVPRAPEALERLRRTYQHVDTILDGTLDGLIVTGMEPKAPRLNDAPYWGRFEQLLEWAERHTLSSVWSCLAAHAAVLGLDGIERRRLEQKCCGVFEHAVVAAHPLVHGVGSLLAGPHSRWNDLPIGALRARGYTIIASSPEAGAHLFVRQRRSLFVFFQGHPEYDDTTLLKEYRRDVARFLRGEQSSYPSLPRGYFPSRSTRLLDAFRERALAAPSPALLPSFPMDEVTIGLQNTWGTAAVRIYRNWLSSMAAAKEAGGAAVSARV